MKCAIAILAMGLGLICSAPALAKAAPSQAVLGEAIFNRDCAVCHDNSMHMLNDNGPALFGVVGRRVGSNPGYDYSPVLKQANARGDVWNARKLDRFFAGPERMYPGTSMPMNFGKAADRKAIIAYLKSLKAQN